MTHEEMQRAKLAGLYIVQSRAPRTFRDENDEEVQNGWMDWCIDNIGDNEPRSREKCEADCMYLPGCGPEWARCEYRVVEAYPRLASNGRYYYVEA